MLTINNLKALKVTPQAIGDLKKYYADDEQFTVTDLLQHIETRDDLSAAVQCLAHTNNSKALEYTYWCVAQMLDKWDAPEAVIHCLQTGEGAAEAIEAAREYAADSDEALACIYAIRATESPNPAAWMASASTYGGGADVKTLIAKFKETARNV